MTIERIEAIPLQVPFDSGSNAIGWRGRRYSKVEITLVRVTTTDGCTGWGEAFSYNCQRPVVAAIDDMIAPLVVGRCSRNIAGLSFELQKTLHIYGRYGILNFALSGLDIALWDIAGKRARCPLGDLLGGVARNRIEAYAGLFRYDDPEQVAERIRSVLAEGYRRVKVHGHRLRDVAAARAAAGDDVPLMLDTNCSWTASEAVQNCRLLERYRIDWLEEPIFPPEDFASLADLRGRTSIPLASGENACTAFEFHKMIAAGAVAVAQPSVTKVGGVTEFCKVATLTEAFGLDVRPHSPVFGPGFLATLQLLAAQPREAPIERFHIKLEGSLYGNLMDPVAGLIELPSGPGLGLDPDPEVIEAYRVEG